MARTYWRVSPAFWGDEKVKGHEEDPESGWSDDAKLLALYLLTCEHRTCEGLYRLPKGYIMEDLGWTSERLAEPFQELLAEGFIKYDGRARVVLICNALDYQAPENPNQEKAAIKLLSDLPETSLFEAFLSLAERYAQPFAQRLLERLPERFPERMGQGYGKPPLPSPPPPAPSSPPGKSRKRDCGKPPGAVDKPSSPKSAREAALQRERDQVEANRADWDAIKDTPVGQAILGAGVGRPIEGTSDKPDTIEKTEDEEEFQDLDLGDDDPEPPPSRERSGDQHAENLRGGVAIMGEALRQAGVIGRKEEGHSDARA